MTIKVATYETEKSKRGWIRSKRKHVLFITSIYDGGGDTMLPQHAHRGQKLALRTQFSPSLLCGIQGSNSNAQACAASISPPGHLIGLKKEMHFICYFLKKKKVL